MDILEFTRLFNGIEEELKLLDPQDARQVPWWDVVRYDVHQHVYARIQQRTRGSAPDVPLSRRLRNLAARKIHRAALEVRSRLGRHDVIVFRAPRLVREGRRIDIALDQLLSVCPGRHLVIDSSPHRYDRRFASQQQLAERPTDLGDLESAMRRTFGVDIDLDQFVRHRLADFEIARRHYRALFERVRPRLVLISQDGIQKGLFRAAREAGVTCVEVQHGLINAAHPAYAYPAHVTGTGLAMFPDVLLTFSNFWIDTCHYPASRRVAIGNDAFVPPATGTPSGQDVMVVSADFYHATLTRWIKAVAPGLPGTVFHYKLHPNQSAHIQAIRQEFAGCPNVRVVGTDVAIHDLLPRVADVVLIQSTVAYEALQSGKRLLLLKDLDYSAHADLFALPGVRLIDDCAALTTALSGRREAFPPPAFFDAFDAPRARALLLDFLNAPRRPTVQPPVNNAASR